MSTEASQQPRQVSPRRVSCRSRSATLPAGRVSLTVCRWHDDSRPPLRCSQCRPTSQVLVQAADLEWVNTHHTSRQYTPHHHNTSQNHMTSSTHSITHHLTTDPFITSSYHTTSMHSTSSSITPCHHTSTYVITHHMTRRQTQCSLAQCSRADQSHPSRVTSSRGGHSNVSRARQQYGPRPVQSIPTIVPRCAPSSQRPSLSTAHQVSTKQVRSAAVCAVLDSVLPEPIAVTRRLPTVNTAWCGVNIPYLACARRRAQFHPCRQLSSHQVQQ